MNLSRLRKSLPSTGGRVKSGASVVDLGLTLFLALVCSTMLGRLGLAQSDSQTSQGGRRARESPKDAAEISFVDVAPAAGLGAVRIVGGGVESKRYLLETMGGGVAFFDYDNDGWLDVFFVNGTTVEGFPEKEAPTNQLFRSNGDGTFSDVTRKAGLVRSGWGQGVCVGNVDNDSHDDLFVTYWGDNALYRNNGDGTFEDISERAGVTGTQGRWSTGCTFFDYDRDGHLDLFVANYVTFEFDRAPLPGDNYFCTFKGIPVACGPEGLAGGTNILYRNRGDGTFEDVSDKSGVAIPRGPKMLTVTAVGRGWTPMGTYGFAAVSGDFDDDAWPDVYVSSDTVPSLLYRNNRNGTFTEIAIPAGCGLSGDGQSQGGMGAAVADYDGDGWLDIVKANFAGDGTTLYRNNGGGSFYDASHQSGVAANSKYVGMGVGFFDFDNDGWKDIFVANGHVYPEADRAPGDPGFKQPNLLFRNLGNGRFQEVSESAGPGMAARGGSHGCAFGDFDNDGDVDIVVSNNNDAPHLLRNDGGNHRNSILLRLVGTRSNRNAVGARVRVMTGERVQTLEVSRGNSFLSHSDFRLHFGLGKATSADAVEIRWPSGLSERVENISANRVVVFQEGAGILTSQPFANR